MKVRVARAPRKWRMPMRVHCAITRLFTEIPRNMQSDRGEFAKRDPFIARHCTSIRDGKSHGDRPKTKRCEGRMAVR
ncbi:hypothetical protein, partial [Burkholderia cenocepacia]|uniref:hypothetical protein n=1 Tax=Burkholderia cenocepacia TaxID=95486 RepID=UPI001955441A